jgi:hypothetical protein
MAITIDRTGITLTNDTGTPSSPVGDGTLLNAADRVAVLDRIDELFNGTRASTFTLGTLLAVDGFGVHNFSAGGTGANVVAVRNTTAGTGNYTELRAGNDSSASLGRFIVTASTYTSVGATYQAGLTIDSSGAGGLNLAASHASGPLRLFTGGSTQRYAIDSAGTHTYLNSTVTAIPLAAGSVSSPSLTCATDTNTGLYFTAATLNVAVDGVQAATFTATANSVAVTATGGAFGTGALRIGALITAARNTSGSGAPGLFRCIDRGGSNRYLWCRDNGDWQTSTSAPDESTGDNTGTVIGTQTSTRATKRAIEAFVDYGAALALIARTPLYRFQYRQGDTDTDHVGIMADESPEFTRYQQTAFDPVNAFGYTAAAIKALLRRVDTLEAALAARG